MIFSCCSGRLRKLYRRVERVAILVGLLSYCSFPAALLSHPNWGALAQSMTTQPFLNPTIASYSRERGRCHYAVDDFLPTGRSNRQEAKQGHLRVARMDTLLGAVVTQIVMIAVIIANRIGKHSC